MPIYPRKKFRTRGERVSSILTSTSLGYGLNIFPACLTSSASGQAFREGIKSVVLWHGSSPLVVEESGQHK
ncbi:hypothetical protein KJ636_03400 [Patescibacteria group bacterium]|nr:hypothetical protein [Patescibacteria group bacterium]